RFRRLRQARHFPPHELRVRYSSAIAAQFRLQKTRSAKESPAGRNPCTRQLLRTQSAQSTTYRAQRFHTGQRRKTHDRVESFAKTASETAPAIRQAPAQLQLPAPTPGKLCEGTHTRKSQRRPIRPA